MQQQPCHQTSWHWLAVSNNIGLDPGKMAKLAWFCMHVLLLAGDQPPLHLGLEIAGRTTQVGCLKPYVYLTPASVK